MTGLTCPQCGQVLNNAVPFCKLRFPLDRGDLCRQFPSHSEATRPFRVGSDFPAHVLFIPLIPVLSQDCGFDPRRRLPSHVLWLVSMSLWWPFLLQGMSIVPFIDHKQLFIGSLSVSNEIYTLEKVISESIHHRGIIYL